MHGCLFLSNSTTNTQMKVVYFSLTRLSINNTTESKPKKNKCVSRTDTNPLFAFQIAFPRGTDFTGFLQGGSKSYIRCV